MLCFTGISAYYTATDAADNTMTVGHNAVSIMEEFIPPDKLEPGMVITKKVNVENTGETPCAIRVSAEFSDSMTEEIAELDIDEDHWELRKDGYYYYREILDTGDITHTLFSTVTIADDAEPAELQDFELMIYAESIDAELSDTYTDVRWQRRV